jgi:hypothetical protein
MTSLNYCIQLLTLARRKNVLEELKYLITPLNKQNNEIFAEQNDDYCESAYQMYRCVRVRASRVFKNLEFVNGKLQEKPKVHFN